MKLYLLVPFIFCHLLVNAQNSVCFTIEDNPNSNVSGLGLFTKYVNVLDCFSIYAESSIPDTKVLHAAAVAAELLDNDENGFVDDEVLKTALQSSGALIPIFYQENSSAENQFFTQYNGEGAAAVLYNNEMNPVQTGYWGSDATVEEVIHVINAIGHSSIYPNAFSIEPNSSLMSEAMDVARGGQFINIPNPYPNSAWYHYDDQTCDYGCMAIEYMYWSIVSWMGILNDPSTCNGIANEWEPCSPSLFQSTDILMFALITDPQYQLPQLAPDGNYCPQNSGMESTIGFEDIRVFPNYSEHVIHIKNMKGNNTISLKDTTGRLIYTQKTTNQDLTLDVSMVHSGQYILLIERGSKHSYHKIMIH